jgi:hypothetical protein
MPFCDCVLRPVKCSFTVVMDPIVWATILLPGEGLRDAIKDNSISGVKQVKCYEIDALCGYRNYRNKSVGSCCCPGCQQVQGQAGADYASLGSHFQQR